MFLYALVLEPKFTGGQFADYLLILLAHASVVEAVAVLSQGRVGEAFTGCSLQPCPRPVTRDHF